MPHLQRYTHMRRNLAVIGSTLLIAFAGCGSKPAIQQSESYTFPAVGTVATGGIGDSLIREDTGVLIPKVMIVSDTKIGAHRLPRGSYDYYDANAIGTWFIGGDEYFYLRKGDGLICIDKTKECAQVAHTVDKKLSSLSPNAFQQTLLYNGKIGTRITLGYREFTNNLARPAFSNNVDYDLAESTVVGYKGVRLEVIKATNTEITYRVLAGFAK